MDPSYLVSIFAGRIPLFLLLLGGIGFALMRWNRHPRVSLLTILGLFFYLLESIFFTFILFVLPTLLPAGAMLVASDSVYMVVFLLDDIAYTAVIIVLVSAVFTQRKLEPATSL